MSIYEAVTKFPQRLSASALLAYLVWRRHSVPAGPAPYPLLHKLGTWMGRTSMRFMKRRVSIARRNLELCFPEMEKDHLERCIIGNFESLGMGLLETGMAWFWSDRRVRRWFSVKGLHNLQAAQANGRGR